VQKSDQEFKQLLQKAGVKMPANLSAQKADLDRDLNYHPLHPAGNPIYVAGWNKNQPKILLNVITPPVTPVIYNEGNLTNDESAEFRRVVTANWDALRSVAQWYYGDETATTSAGTSNQAPEKKMNCPNCKAYLEVSKFTKDKWQKLVCPSCKKSFKG
jgi:hypothetical protein